MAASLAQAAPAAPIRFVVYGDYVLARRIMIHNFLSCQARRRDAWSQTACPYWVPVTTDQLIDISGQWCLFARWEGDRMYRRAVLVPTGSVATQFPVRPHPPAEKGECG